MPSREEQIANTLVSLADTLVTGYDVAEVFYFLVDSCRSVLSADQSGLMLTDAGRSLHVVAVTSETTHLIDQLQLALNTRIVIEQSKAWQPSTSILKSTRRSPGFADMRVTATSRLATSPRS